MSLCNCLRSVEADLLKIEKLLDKIQKDTKRYQAEEQDHTIEKYINFVQKVHKPSSKNINKLNRQMNFILSH